eukprot:5372096-Pleurochrysis_carterae.AAC.3
MRGWSVAIIPRPKGGHTAASSSHETSFRQTERVVRAAKMSTPRVHAVACSGHRTGQRALDPDGAAAEGDKGAVDLAQAARTVEVLSHGIAAHLHRAAGAARVSAFGIGAAYETNKGHATSQ